MSVKSEELLRRAATKAGTSAEDLSLELQRVAEAKYRLSERRWSRGTVRRQKVFQEKVSPALVVKYHPDRLTRD